MSIIRNGLESADLDVPVVLPTLNLDFANSQSLDSRITFTRGSIGTRVNRNGLIETIPANVPRFDYDPISGECKGLLIEESRTNLLTYSEDFSNATWSKGNLSVLPNTSLTLSPDGTATAETLYAVTTGGSNVTHAVTGSYTGLTPNASYTFSVFVKKAQTKYMVLGSWDGAAGLDVYFNIEDGTILYKSASLTSVTITPYLGGWYRVSSTRTISSTTLVPVIYVNRSSDGNVIYQGDGSSIYAWGAQLEQGAFPTSYIPTTASTVTRSADNVSVTGTNFSSWYNQSEGTLFAASRINALGGSGFPGIAYVDDGTTNNCIGFYVNDAGDDKIGVEAYISGRGQYFLFSSSATTANKLNKAISSYSINNFSGAFDTSSQIQRDTSGSIPTVNRLRIGTLRGDVYKLNGTISRLTYYPKALPPAQLQYLTQ